jgi:thiamine biosynthesis lipoprotein
MRRARPAAAIAWAAALFIFAPGLCAAEGERPAAAQPLAMARFLMGTRLSIEVGEQPAPEALEAAFEEVERLEAVLSNWKPDSEVTRLNDRASSEWVRCSRDLYGAVGAALHWAADTGGAFDPTVEPLVRLLGLRAEGGFDTTPRDTPRGAATGTAPAGGAGRAVMDRLPIGWRHVLRRGRSRSVRYDTPGVGLDFGGIGKGIALDAAARILARRGVRIALLDFGGQVLAMGRPRGTAGWPVGVADPQDRDVPVAVLRGSDVSISTSGNGERAVQGPDGPIGHILDPGARRPASFQGTATVAAKDGTSADALSTALFVMGPERGRRWADERRIAALFLWRNPDGTLGRSTSRAFDQRFPGWSGTIPEMTMEEP